MRDFTQTIARQEYKCVAPENRIEEQLFTGLLAASVKTGAWTIAKFRGSEIAEKAEVILSSLKWGTDGCATLTVQFGVVPFDPGTCLDGSQETVKFWIYKELDPATDYETERLVPMWSIGEQCNALPWTPSFPALK
jgi:hypothetical protein